MAEPVALNHLAAELGLGPHEHIAIVGGGGKTTILHTLGQQLTGTVVLTCTTKMGSSEHRGLPVVYEPTVDRVREAVAKGRGPVMVWKAIDGPKAVGVRPEHCDAWFEVVDQIVIEADGSKQRPFKAPANYEPVVPSTTTVMVSVIGADALGRVIADRCHRPLRVAALAGCHPFQRLSPAAAASVLLHERGARKELPAGARFCVVVTKIDPVSEPFVDQLVDELRDRDSSVPVVVVGSQGPGEGTR
ncbi:MAG: putative selenium-dependent hydroxylase accessory protein YqeC [Actinomycetia bacterium]|nr:putative selenium-dependent hydroxylase accessory protein YqeC [Actinomycetes bacterium]